MLYTGNDDTLIRNFKASMMREFDMSDHGRMNYFLGIELMQRQNGIFICQNHYAKSILRKFGMSESHAVSTPISPGMKIHSDVKGTVVDANHFKQIVGSLMYLTATRSDLAFATSLLSRYMSRPTILHLQLAKCILRYLNGTVGYGVLYRKANLVAELQAYTDSDYVGDVEDRKSIGGYVFLLNSGAVA